MHPTEHQRRFFGRNPLVESIVNLFDGLPQIHFYIKDHESRFMRVNHRFAENHGLSHPDDAVGLTDHDLHAPLFAKAYTEEDRRVMKSRHPMAGQVWLVIFQRLTPCWYLSTKT
ncbi:MAG: PAS domain-containing protein, partial [Planctomycetota bacterium]